MTARADPSRVQPEIDRYLMSIVVRVMLYLLIVMLFGYPAAALTVHGLDPSLWPGEVIAPGAWFDAFRFLQLGTIAEGLSQAVA